MAYRAFAKPLSRWSAMATVSSEPEVPKARAGGCAALIINRLEALNALNLSIAGLLCEVLVPRKSKLATSVLTDWHWQAGKVGDGSAALEGALARTARRDKNRIIFRCQCFVVGECK